MYFNNPQVKYGAKKMHGSVQKPKINLDTHGSFSSQQEYKEKDEKGTTRSTVVFVHFSVVLAKVC